MWMKRAALFLLAITVMTACKKYEDKPGDGSDPRLQHPYCNTPSAVNYNWDFPGKPDSTVCTFPTDYFGGNYLFVDSLYLPDGTSALADSIYLTFIPLNRFQLGVTGFCLPGDTLRLTVNRYLRATIDTTVTAGQLLCQPGDTIAGYFWRSLEDSVQMHLNYTILRDTGVSTHAGTAIRL